MTVHHCNEFQSEIRTREEMKARTRRGGYTPSSTFVPKFFVLLHISFKFSIFLHISLKFSVILYISLPSHSYGYPHKKSDLVHLYPSKNWHNCHFYKYLCTHQVFSVETQTHLTTSYFVIALYMFDECSPLCFTLSLPSTCLMNVLLYIFAPHIGVVHSTPPFSSSSF